MMEWYETVCVKAREDAKTVMYAIIAEVYDISKDRSQWCRVTCRVCNEVGDTVSAVQHKAWCFVPRVVEWIAQYA